MLIATEVTKVSQDGFNLPTTAKFHENAAPEHSPVMLTLGDTALIRSNRLTGCQVLSSICNRPTTTATISVADRGSELRAFRASRIWSAWPGQKTLVATGVVRYDLARLSRFFTSES